MGVGCSVSRANKECRVGKGSTASPRRMCCLTRPAEQRGEYDQDWTLFASDPFQSCYWLTEQLSAAVEQAYALLAGQDLVSRILHSPSNVTITTMLLQSDTAGGCGHVSTFLEKVTAFKRC